MTASLFKITSLFYLFNAFLLSSKLPDGLFTTKELGLYFSVGLSCLLAVLAYFRKKQKITSKLNIGDLLVLSYLILIPLFQFLFQWSGLGNIAVHSAYGFAYFSLRVLISDLKPVELVNALAELLVTVFCFQLLIAIAQHGNLMPSYYPLFGATGMFFNPGPFAIFTSALIAFVFVLWFIKLLQKQYGWLVFYTLILGLGIYFVALSLSRSAWIGLFIGMLFSSLIILFVHKEAFFRRYKIPVRISALIFFLALIPIGLFLYKMKADSANGRGLVWRSTGLMISDLWDRGVGIGNFAPQYIHYQAAYLSKSNDNLEKYGQLAGDSRYAFNDLLHTFAESGLIGVLLFLSIVVYLFFISIRFICLHKAKHWAILLICGGMSSLIVILIAGLTSYPLQMVPISILFWFIVVIIVSVQPAMNGYALKSGGALFVAIVLTLSAGLYFYYFKVKTQAYLEWMAEDKNVVKDVDKLLSFYPLLNNSSHYLLTIGNEYMDKKEYGKAIVYLKRAVQYSPSKEFYYALGNCYEKQGNILEAEKNYLLVQQAIPNLLKPYYLVAMMHYNNGDVKVFKMKAKEALDFKPKINNGEVMQMQQELQQRLLEVD